MFMEQTRSPASFEASKLPFSSQTKSNPLDVPVVVYSAMHTGVQVPLDVVVVEDELHAL
jgi:hypothetical protein